jgi:uncharacterized protein (DUF305 family)
MTLGRYHLAAAGAALAAAVALAACGSGSASPGTPGTATSQPAATAPASSPATQASAADVAFTAGVLGLENQAAVLAALAPAHTATAQVRQFAAGVDAHAGEYRQMHAMMGQWGHAAPAPYTPGATPPPGTGRGMMSTGDWAEMERMHGADFNDHFTGAMIANRTAEIALCRTELAGGASPQAQALARTMLTERQAELAQLQAWRNQSQHGMMSG